MSEMLKPDRHEMQLQRSYPSGAEEWHCPTCRRSLIMHHQPLQGRLKIIVLAPGDELASHHGASGGLTLQGVQVRDAEGETAPVAYAPMLH
ncbi:MAG: hypothetical protein ACREVP_06080 [Burkholderiales bacterium]